MSKKSSKWYKNHINDEFVKLANKENWRSRAVFKLKEIDEKYNLIKANSRILDLGSAPGGWSQYASQKHKNIEKEREKKGEGREGKDRTKMEECSPFMRTNFPLNRFGSYVPCCQDGSVGDALPHNRAV